jgi:CheY-like chemotaxis protein
MIQSITIIPMIALSSLGDSYDKISKSFKYYLSKPIKHSKLLNIFLNIFNVKSDTITQHQTIRNQIMKPLRILIAEDTIMNKKIIINMLKKLAYHDIDVVSHGLEALERLEKKKYDVLLLDIKMPVMDGYTTAKVICNKYKIIDRPYIIATTAYAMKGDREKCYECGIDGYISKPIIIDELSTMLQIVEEKKTDTKG